jgi:outer membrane autotransporter protein
MVQLDNVRQRSLAQATEVNGKGWMAGPYATFRVADAMFWQGRAAWGRSSNTVRPFETYTDSFKTNRWLLSSALTGRWGRGPWVFSPSVSLSYMEDAAKSYTDTFSMLIPGIRSRLGQVKAGPRFDYRYHLRPGVTLEPRAGLQLISNFAGTTTVAGLGQISGENTNPVGVRGRAEAGLRVIMRGGIGIDLSGSYDGIGARDYPSLAGQVMVRVPLD